jgi:hypothetical protein
MEQRWRPKPELSWREIDNDLVAVDTGTGEYHCFNDVGRVIWLGIANGHDDASIVRSIVEAFSTESDRAASDLAVFVADLSSRGLLVEACE